MRILSDLSLRIKNSLALELLAVVFSTYLLVAISITVVHVIVTYNSTKTRVEKNIASVWNITQAGLSRAVWELDQGQIRAVLKGILESPHVTGVKIIDRKGQQVDAIGLIQQENGNYYDMSLLNTGKPITRTGLILYEQKFPIQITEFNRFNSLGDLMIYSSNQIIFDAVKFDLFLILLNAVLKTTALWGIFLWFSWFILHKPLKLFTRAAQQIDMENLENFNLPVFKKGKNELGILREAFVDMVGKLSVARDSLKEINKNLEENVKERTTRLNKSNYQLRLKNDKLEDQHKQLKKAQSQLIQAEKMSGLGTLVAGIAHEINNPTNFINGNIKLIRKEIANLFDFIVDMAGGTDADSQVISAFRKKFNKINLYVTDVLDGSQRIISIISDLQSFSRMDQNIMTDVNLIKGLESTLRIIQAKYKNEISFVTDYLPIPDICCWPAKLNQVFMNILLNSCQAIVERKNSDAGAGRLKISTYCNSGKIFIVFNDNGIGMDQEALSQVFDPFYSTKPVGEGTGLGMSISYGIIRNHDGEIEVNSFPGEGTSITVSLPVKK